MNIQLIGHGGTNIDEGASGSLVHLLLEYKKLGHQARFYSFNDLPGWLPDKVGASTPTTDVVFPYFVAAHIHQLVRRERIDVVDAAPGDAWLWGKTRGKLNDTLLVTRSHGLDHTIHLMNLEEARLGNLDLSRRYRLYLGGFRLWEVATSFRCADLAFFLNRYELDYAVRELGVSPERARIVANGIPEAFLGLPFEATPVAQDEPVRIALIATYDLRKGKKYAPPALNAILTRHPQVQVAYLGTGCPANQVLADHDPSVRGRIKVVPRYARTELPALLKGYQIKLFPTLMEGFGKALVEAMACGLAPIVTSTPGPLEIVRDGHDALVVPVRDSKAIERAFERLITDRALLDRLRLNAQATAQAYSWSQIAQHRLQLYEAFLQSRRLGK